MKSHCGDKTVVRSSYLHSGISYNGKMTSLYCVESGSRAPHCWPFVRELWGIPRLRVDYPHKGPVMWINIRVSGNDIIVTCRRIHWSIHKGDPSCENLPYYWPAMRWNQWSCWFSTQKVNKTENRLKDIHSDRKIMWDYIYPSWIH